MKSAIVHTALTVSVAGLLACEGGAVGEPPLSSPDGGVGPGNPVDARPAPLCQVGDPVPCSCPDGSEGRAFCVAPDGEASQCGCPVAGGADVLVPPPPPDETVCGGIVCPPYLEASTEVSARGCCTEGDTCGSASSFVFGDACVPRDGDPGVEAAVCPDENPNFLDLAGCCRADGRCGLSVAAIPNFDDVGCIERSEMATLLNEGATERFFLSLVFLLPYEPADYEPVPCGASE